MTGDAVVLDVDIAQRPVRAVSAMIDLIVVGALYIAAVLLRAAALPRLDEAFTAAVLVIFTVVVIVGYPLGMEMATRGRSLGKMAMGLRVARLRSAGQASQPPPAVYRAPAPPPPARHEGGFTPPG